MLPCISVSNMRLSDRQTIERGVSGRTLMRRAAAGVYRAAPWRGRIAIAVGSGNNGGDGYALACVLKAHGIDSRVVQLTDKRSDDGAHFARRAAALGVPMAPYAAGCFAGSDIIVDCLLGTGFSGAVRPSYAAAIREINASGAFVVSVDINSGMDGDTGKAELAVRSDLTVSVGYVKNGQAAPGAGAYMKRLVCADIGIELDHEENRICSEGEPPPSGGQADILPRPPWLDMAVLDIRHAMDLLCLGDSNTYGYKPFSDRYGPEVRWTERLQALDCRVYNRGANGLPIPDERSYPALTQLLRRCRPDAVTVMLGSNDLLLEGRSPEETAARMERLLRHLLAHTAARVILIAPPPFRRGVWVPTQAPVESSLRLTQHYRALAGHLGVLFADAGEWGVTLTGDGVHFTAEGHAAFAEGLTVFLEEIGF